MRWTVFTGALALLLLGCIPPPKQTAGLAFFDHEGLAYRMGMLCRLGVGDDEIKTACAVPEMHRRLTAEANPSDEDPDAGDALADELASKSCSDEKNEGTLSP